MMTGTVVTVQPDRGFAFIEPRAGGDNVFVHVSQLRGGLLLDAQLVGRRVTYGTELDRTGRVRAINVQPEV